MKSSLRWIANLPILMCTMHTGLNVQVQGRHPARVGVALSGGGALGWAHIGVIRYFEEHHIPIDDIGGTSTGGLVGGLYATGMDSKQLTQVVERLGGGWRIGSKLLTDTSAAIRSWRRPNGTSIPAAHWRGA